MPFRFYEISRMFITSTFRKKRVIVSLITVVVLSSLIRCRGARMKEVDNGITLTQNKYSDFIRNKNFEGYDDFKLHTSTKKGDDGN